MNRMFWTRHIPLTVLLSAAVILISAWQNKPRTPAQNTTDTIPDRSKMVQEMNGVLDELERSRSDIEKSLQEIDWKKMHAELMESMKALKNNAALMKLQVDQSLKEIDMARIQADVRKSMNEIDLEKMKRDLNKSVSEIDTKKIKEEIELALRSVDVDKIRAEVNASLAAIDWDKIQSDIKDAQEKAFKKMQTDLKKIGPEIEKSMSDARQKLEISKNELSGFNQFIDLLHQNGLIQKNEDYSISYRSEELIINGKKQKASVLNQYKDFLQSHQNFEIKKVKDALKISND